MAEHHGHIWHRFTAFQQDTLDDASVLARFMRTDEADYAAWRYVSRRQIDLQRLWWPTWDACMEMACSCGNVVASRDDVLVHLVRGGAAAL